MVSLKNTKKYWLLKIKIKYIVLKFNILILARGEK